jgi:hypothetical protein
MIKCYACHTPLTFNAQQNIPRQEACPKCLRDLHVCKMCMYYDVKSYNECREPSADRIVDKEKFNYCDFFKLSDQNQMNNTKDDIMAKANALFKKN